ncbi:MAG: hypothetical protein KF914_15090 [Rhizobiaceae bacterium]|nr:hypothetical protein [Rhizobiaceae bacterium]
MNTLQIQDEFQPYYADAGSKASTSRMRALSERAPTDRRDDVRARLEACRARLATAIATDAAGRH